MPLDHADIVLFFDDTGVSKEMLLPEFEAVLEHVVSLPEFEEQCVKAAYVRVSSQLHVVSAVLFTLDFDKRGIADPKWNLPLQHLATNSSTGPDLGGGKIRLACTSQCPIEWHRKRLWDPILTPTQNTLAQIKNAVIENKLELEDFEAEEEDFNESELGVDPGFDAAAAMYLEQSIEVGIPDVLEQSFEAGMASPSEQGITDGVEHATISHFDNGLAPDAPYEESTQLINELHTRIQTEKDQHAEEQSRLKQEFEKHLGESKAQASQLQQQCKEHESNTERLKSELAERQQTLQNERELFNTELQAVLNGEFGSSGAGNSESSEQVASLRKELSEELQAKFDDKMLEMKDELHKRRLELFYRDEQITGLSEEITNLRQEHVRLMNQGENAYLMQLADLGVEFVAHHEGVGHLTIAATEVGKYLDAPIAYAAKKCSVTLEHYEQWLEHFDDSVCQAQVMMDDAEDGDGVVCGRQVPAVETPKQFVADFSNRCTEHQQQREFVSSDAVNDSSLDQQADSQREHHSA